MAHAEATVRAGILARLDEFLASKSIALRPLLAQAGLTAGELKEPDARVSLNAVARLLDIAALKAGDPCLGIHYGEIMPAGSSGIVGHLVMSAPTLGDALRSIERYLDLFVSPVAVTYTESRSGALITWKYPETLTAPRVQFSGLTIAALLARLQQSVGADLRPRSVELDHRAFECAADVKRLLGNRVRYNRPENSVMFDASALRRRITGVRTGVFGLMRQLGDRLLEEQRQEADIVAQTRRQIALHVRDGQNRLPDIARRFGLTPRALQGRLKLAGTSFAKLSEQTRKEMAANYLRNTGLSITEIALLLGFSELSAFTRSVQRWFGKSPKAFRAEAWNPTAGER
jgi:AraC-like DNA-binding protein